MESGDVGALFVDPCFKYSPDKFADARSVHTRIVHGVRFAWRDEKAYAIMGGLMRRDYSANEVRIAKC